MTALPKPPTGPHPLEHVIRQLIECVRERTILPGFDIAVVQTKQGVILKTKGGKGVSMREMQICINDDPDCFVMVAAGQPYKYDEAGNKVPIEDVEE